MHDRNIATELALELLSGLRATDIGRHDAHFFGIDTLILEIIHENRHSGHMVHRNVEEALDCILVQVNGNEVIGTGDGNEVGNELCRDGLARGGLALLTGVAVVRDDSRNGAGACALGRIDHDEHFHERIVDVLAGDRLNNKDIGAAHRVEVTSVNLAIGKLLELHVAKRGPQLGCNLIGQTRVYRTREDGHALCHLGHARAPSQFFDSAPLPQAQCMLLLIVPTPSQEENRKHKRFWSDKQEEEQG